jgi:hypothetical protein
MYDAALQGGFVCCRSNNVQGVILLDLENEDSATFRNTGSSLSSGVA